MFKSSLAASASAMVLLFWGGEVVAQAQQSVEPPAQPQAKEGASQNVIFVTARRREENLQDVPISITALSGEDLDEQGIDDLKQLSNFAPGVEINSGRPDGGGTTAQIFIRGVGQNDFLIPNEPGVGLYIDDVYVTSSSGAVNSLGDVQSVEILRGPQGTLYGKNTIGGAIRISTVQPEFDEFSGQFKLAVGSYNRINVGGRVNIPLSESAALRVSASSKNADDLQDRPLDPSGNGQGNENQDAVRAALRVNASDSFEFTVSGDYTRIRQNGPYGGNIAFVAGGSALVDILNAEHHPIISDQLGLPPGTTFDAQWATAPGDVGATGPNADNYDVWGIAAVAKLDITPDISIKSITAYRDVKGFAGRDGDSSPFDVLSTTSFDDNNQFSQEFQLTGSSLEDRLQWTFGLYYMHQEMENRVIAKLWDGLVTTSLPIDFNARSLSTLDGDSYAIFGQGTLDVTPELHITVGGRYSMEKRDFDTRWFFLEQPREFTCPGVDVTGELIDCESTDNVFTPTATIAYDVGSDVMLYASYSEGFKVGGWTPRLFSQQSLKRFEPEKLKSYEIGAKASLLDGRGTFNIAVFQSDYSNLQLTSVQADSTGAPQPVVENAGSARIRGAEVDMAFRLDSGTSFTGGLTYLDGEYRQLDPGVSFPITARLPETPKLSLNGSIEQSFDMNNGGNLKARVDASYRSKTYKDPGNAEVIAQKPFTLVNARLAYTSPNERVELAIFGTNLLDEIYITSGLDIVSTFSFYEAYFGRPREFGAELTVNFW